MNKPEDCISYYRRSVIILSPNAEKTVLDQKITCNKTICKKMLYNQIKITQKVI